MTYLLLLALIGCGKDEKPKSDKLDMNEIKTESAVEFAEKSLPELDQKLASTDPGAASSLCAVIKPDLRRIEIAKPELAATVKRKCGHDYAIRSLAVQVDKLEKDPHECAYVPSYDKTVTAANAQSEPEVVKLHERIAAACKK